MAQLKDSLITGDLRVTGTIYGNATSANKLSTARTINGTSFDGTANITTANWGTARNIYIADNSATNTGPAVSVNGSANATLKLPATIKASLTGNASTATTLQTTRTIWGQNFNGSANITGNLIDVGTEIRAIAGNTLINFLTSTGGALNGKFGAIGLSGNYSQTDLSTYRFDVNGNSRFTGNINIAGANNGIYFIGSKAATRMIRMFDNTGDANGNGIGISGGGLVIIGSGEYTDNLYTAMSSPSGGTETTYIGSDNSIFLEGGGQTIANRIGIEINGSGHVIPVKAEAGNNNAQNLGSTSYRWANIYATNGNFNGSLIAPTDNNMICHGNELNYVPTLTANMEIHINHRQTGGNNTGGFKITKYHFKDGAGGLLATISAGQFSGNAATATKLATARTISLTGSVTGSGTFDGSGNLSITTTTNHSHSYLPLTGGTMTGQIKSSKAGGSWIQGRNNACLYQTITTSNNWHPVVGFKTPSGSWTIGNVGDNENCVFSYDTDTNFSAGTNTVMSAIYFNSSGYIYANRVYNAVWNDYAEYRKYNDGEIPYGKVVCENGDDSVSISTKRLQPGAMICSDTFGTSMGDENGSIPIAVAGRVLAYPLEPREEYNFFIGQAVCSGPNGTVSIMTKDEVKEYPECVIGYISAVPKYEIWGSGNVKVDGRIWIKVK